MEKKCEICGTEYEEALEKCPLCNPEKIGEKTGEQDDAEQNVVEKEVENVESTTETVIEEKKVERKDDKEISIKVSSSGLKKMIIGIVAAIALAFWGMMLYNSNKEQQFDSNVRSALSSMLDGGIMAEECASLIHDVWYNTIYEKADPETNYYTVREYYRDEYKNSTYVPDYYFNEDFNDSLIALFSDYSFQYDLDLIESNKARVDGIMKKLTDVPKGKESAYNAVENLYDEYVGLINCVLNPTGSLITFTETFNAYDSGFLKAYEKAKLYE